MAVLVLVLVLGAWSCPAPPTGGGTEPMAGPTTAGYAAQAAGEPWRSVDETGEPAFENGWGGVARFRLREPGMVDMDLNVYGGTPGAAIFTLPEGYRPTSNLNIPVTGEIGSTPSAGLVRVATDGIVRGERDGSADHEIIYMMTQVFLDSF